MHTPPQPHEDEAPPRVGRYELLRRIGVGGMATVYLARRRSVTGHTSIYALKVMHKHLVRENDLVTMMMDEARLVARINHPNVVGIVDVGVSDGSHYIALEYVDGVALDRLFERKPNFRPPSHIIPIAMDALLGLAVSHELVDDEGRSLELVHRDVTPGNILVGVDGIGRITDFGIAKARARATQTLPGVVKGKVGYLAPEVMLGADFDGRADLFSMGVVLWNALTGETLYDTDDIGMSIQQLASEEAPPPSTVGLRPPPIFDLPIQRALARDPAERFHSAREMHQALEDALLLHGGKPPRRDIGEWVQSSFSRLLEKRRELAKPDVEVDMVSPPEDLDSTVTFRTVPGEEDDTERTSIPPPAVLAAEAEAAAREAQDQGEAEKMSPRSLALGIFLVIAVGCLAAVMTLILR